jgi:signal transduction histidine kinase
MQNTKERIMLSDKSVRLKNEIVKLRLELAAKESEIIRIKGLKRQFVRMVTHDLRNPLGVISSFSEFLIDETKDVLTDGQKDFLSRIQNSTKLMLTLIGDLIELSNLDGQNLAINAEILDIVSLVSENIKQKRALAEEKNVKISFESSSAIVFVFADAERLEKLLNILISNAIMYSEPGTTIIVKLSKEDESILIRVKDSGMGIAVSNPGKIFIPCEKIGKVGTNSEIESGLGLSIVKRIIEEHRGKICVESEMGKGSSIMISLPLK